MVDIIGFIQRTIKLSNELGEDMIIHKSEKFVNDIKKFYER